MQLDDAVVRSFTVAWICSNRRARFEPGVLPWEKYQDYNFGSIDEITVEWRGLGKYGVFLIGYRLSKKDLAFDPEPQPSSRTQEYLDEHTFDSIDEAIDGALTYLAARPDYIEYMVHPSFVKENKDVQED